MSITSYLSKSRHGIYYLRIQRGGLDKRISLRTRDRRVAELAAYEFGARIRSMDIKKLLESQSNKAWELAISGDAVTIKTDGSDKDHHHAMEALTAVLASRAHPSAASSSAPHTITLKAAISEYEPYLQNQDIAEKSKKMALQALGKMRLILGDAFSMSGFSDEAVRELWMQVRLGQVAGSSVKKELTFIRAFSAWASAQARGYCPAPLTFTVPASKTKNQHWDYFTGSDLKRIFDDLPKPPRKMWQYWAPVIALYTGARVGEIASLRVDHFFEKAGIKAVHLPGTKTDSAARDVPIHDDLIRLGLLDYVESRRKAGKAMLFDLVVSAQNGPGASVSKWFGRHLTARGVTGRKAFHSFRHTMVDHLRQHGAPLEARMQFIGHAAGGGVHNEVYGRASLGLPMIARDVVNKIDWQAYCGWSLAAIPPHQ